MKTKSINLFKTALLFSGFIANAQNNYRGTEPVGYDSSPKNYAIIVGVSKYEDKVFPQLDNPEKEVDVLSNKLSKNWSFKSQNIFGLKNISKKDFEKAVKELNGKVTERDNVLLYLSLHGKYEADEYYFQFSDAKYNDSNTWLSAKYLYTLLKSKLIAKHLLVVIDACYGGAFFDTYVFKGSGGIPSIENVSNMKEIKSGEIITSGTKFQRVPDKSDFFKAFINVLDNWKYNYLPASYLHPYIKDKMAIEHSVSIPDYDAKILSSYAGGSFIFERTGGENLPSDKLIQNSYIEEQKTTTEVRPVYFSESEKKDIIKPVIAPTNSLNLTTGPVFFETTTQAKKEKFEVLASGQIYVTPLARVTPDGRVTTNIFQNYAKRSIVPQLPNGGLMYRITESDSWKHCGSRCSIVLPKKGSYKVEFRCNDNFEGNNDNNWVKKIDTALNGEENMKARNVGNFLINITKAN